MTKFHATEIIGHAAKLAYIAKLQKISEFESSQSHKNLQVWRIKDQSENVVAIMINDNELQEYPLTFWSLGTGDLLAFGDNENKVLNLGCQNLGY